MSHVDSPKKATPSLRAEARAAIRRGWVLTPLHGKKPVLTEWTTAAPPDARQVADWIARGLNLGLRTGVASGVFVVDEDTGKGGNLAASCEAHGVEIPRTVTVETGGGGLHLYFRAPDPCPGNSASKLGPHIDTRGEGGQVVFVGSVHPTTHEPYRWAAGLSPDDVELAELPLQLLAVLRNEQPEAARPNTHPHASTYGRSKYADAALDREIEALANTAEGARNAQLNVAAFNLGQLIGGGELHRSDVEHALEQAAEACGLVRDDGAASVRATIASGLTAGIAKPRTAPEPRQRPRGRPPLRVVPPPGDAATGGEDADELPEVLVPGGHTDSAGDYHEVRVNQFVDEILATLPPGTLYRRADTAGELVGQPGARTFREATPNRIKYLVDKHVRCIKWVKRKADSIAVKVYQNCSRENAHDVLDAAATSTVIRALELLTPYPVFLGRDLALASPGWNEAHGVYYDEPPGLVGLDPSPASFTPERIRAILDDLTIDFPWKQDSAGIGAQVGSASRTNYYGLLLTPLLRPAIDGNVPMHMILSPIPRTGKTKLAEEILGGVILGRRTPAMQLSGTDEERDKRILATLKRGDTILHLDNIREFLDSGAIASLLTSSTYSGRVLGRSEMAAVPNRVTIVATGNNVRATEELVKRTIPIELATQTDEPEARVDFRHPDLWAHVLESRRDILGALLAAVARWRDGERQRWLWPLGGFERWSEIVGGILDANGIPCWRRNEKAWRRTSDQLGEDLRALVELWGANPIRAQQASARELFELANEADLFPQVRRAATERGQLTQFGMRVLGRHIDAPVGSWFIRRQGSGSSAFYFLEPRES